MLKFILKRVLLSVPIFIGITVIVFVLSNMAPGSPLDIMDASGTLTKQAYEELQVSLGLDKPIIVRYLIWLFDLSRGDFGVSSNTSYQVLQLIGQRIGPSLLLTGNSILLSIMIGIPLGVAAAYKPYSIWDNLSSVISFIGVSTPNFFVSLVLIYIFAVKLNLLPAQGMYFNNTQTLSGLVLHLILPSIVLSIQMLGSFVKQTKGSVLEVLNDDYIKTARAKGLSEIKVVVRHALRNALIPIVTTIGMMVPVLIGGAVITEQIFSWPGIGSLMVLSVNTRDYNTIMGITVIVAVTVIITNIILDVIYTFLDPRIRL